MRTSMNYVLAILAAYGMVLLAPMLFDFAFDTNVELLVIVWLNVGMFIMRAKKMAFPMPDMRRIDIKGALRLMWWALFWPNYLVGH